jgi:transcriptional regulator ATRX
MLAKWQQSGGAMIIGYTAFRNAVSGRTIKDETLRESFKKSLRDPGPDVLICDEAHMIKNIKADITKELKAVKTKRRVALTGSPLQNNLLEYYCMVDFVRERLLGTVKQFRNK